RAGVTKETRYMFGEREIKLMKPHAIVLNTARGKIVDEKALAGAIAEGRIRAAAIDAFEEEPLPMDSPLRALGDRVLLSPHSASYTEGGELRQASPGPRAPSLLRSREACRITFTIER